MLGEGCATLCYGAILPSPSPPPERPLPWDPLTPREQPHQVPQAHASLVRPRVGRAKCHAQALLGARQAGLPAVHDDGAAAERGQQAAGLRGLGLVQLGNLDRELVDPD